MNNNEFMGLLVVSLISLIGLVVAIITPVLKLNTNITRLNTILETLRNENKRHDEKIQILFDRISEISHRQTEDEKELVAIKTKLKMNDDENE